jgi:hypothetical protein
MWALLIKSRGMSIICEFEHSDRPRVGFRIRNQGCIGSPDVGKIYTALYMDTLFLSLMGLKCVTVLFGI